MAAILNDLGEEWLIKTNADSASLDVGLYDDGTDSITDTEDLADITTEPSDGNYSRQTGVAMSAADLSGDWGFDNDSQVSFDVSGTTGSVDSWFMVANFQAVDTGDGGATDHLILTGSLSQSYDLSNVDTLNINAGGVGLSID